jgi:energy-coupling factor transporter transmembrane protein EcfT
MGRISGRARITLVEDSPLRQADPRIKIGLSLCASLAVMLPLQRLLIFLGFYLLLLYWARLIPATAQQIWRIKWILLGLFLLDSLLIDPIHATTITLRLALLTGVLTLVFSTTTLGEFSLGLERLGLPYRYAFSLGLAFNSLQLLEDEWKAIWEAQASRGAVSDGKGIIDLITHARDLIAMTAPAIVLTTKRAWSITEAAYARGFDSPERRPFHILQIRLQDTMLLAGTVLIAAFLILW